MVQAIDETDEPLCVHPDFEAKTQEILDWNLSGGLPGDSRFTVSERELSSLRAAIAASLREAYQGRSDTAECYDLHYQREDIEAGVIKLSQAPERFR